MSNRRGRRVSKHALKGATFPSYSDPPLPSSSPKDPSDRVLPPGRQWTAHDSARARIRRLRQATRRIRTSTHADIVKARERCYDTTAGEPEPEYGALHLMASAIVAADSTGAPWHEVVHYLIDKFEAQAKEPEPAAMSGGAGGAP